MEDVFSFMSNENKIVFIVVIDSLIVTEREGGLDVKFDINWVEDSVPLGMEEDEIVKEGTELFKLLLINTITETNVDSDRYTILYKETNHE